MRYFIWENLFLFNISCPSYSACCHNIYFWYYLSLFYFGRLPSCDHAHFFVGIAAVCRLEAHLHLIVFFMCQNIFLTFLSVILTWHTRALFANTLLHIHSVKNIQTLELAQCNHSERLHRSSWMSRSQCLGPSKHHSCSPRITCAC